MRRTLLAAALVATLPSGIQAQHGADEQGVRRAALDYIEGFYEGDASKLRRSVRPDVVKYGFFVDNGAYDSEPMSFDEMIGYADRVRDRGRAQPATTPREVIILDVQDQTAAVKVIAWWGTDYLQLAKYDGTWMILHVLWQSPPPETN